MKESLEKYNLKYPWYFPPKKVISVLKEGDILTDGEEEYEVIYCYHSLVPNKPPTIEIKRVEVKSDVK